jgi:hypothetical protein
MNSMLRPAFAGVTQPEHDIALAALREITSEESIGEAIGRTENEDGTLNLIFACLLPGYPGWQWNVSIGRVEGDAPTAIEADLLPTDGALVAPEWVPWSLRLADFLEAQKAAAEAGIELEGVSPDLIVVSDDDDDDDDDDDEDHDDDDDDDDDEDHDDDDDDDDELDLGDIIEDVRDVDIDGIEFEEESLPEDADSDYSDAADSDDADADADAADSSEDAAEDENSIPVETVAEPPKKAPRRRFRFLR